MTHSLIFNRYRENIAGLMDKCFPEKNKPGRKRPFMYSQGFFFPLRKKSRNVHGLSLNVSV